MPSLAPLLLLAAALAARPGGAPLTMPGQRAGGGPAGAAEAPPTTAEGWVDRAYVRLARGFTRQAEVMLGKALDQHPDHPVLLPLRGVACAQLGDLPCALTATEGELLDGKELGQARPARALALRETGRPLEAAALRSEGLVLEGLRPPQEAVLWAAISGDLLAAGDHAGALDAALASLAADPESPRPFVALAELALAEGDLEEAEAQLWLAQRGRATPRALAHLEARLALELESPAAAFGVIFDHAKSFRGGRLDAELSSLMVEARRRAGWASGARSVQERESLLLHDELWHPNLLATRALVRADAGDWQGAAEALARAQATYPDHPWVQAAAAALAPDLPAD